MISRLKSKAKNRIATKVNGQQSTYTPIKKSWIKFQFRINDYGMSPGLTARMRSHGLNAIITSKDRSSVVLATESFGSGG